ncbi:MAG: phosphatidate cytidylyltransferase [Vulcanimicrobiaceae bacterium]
MTPRRIVSGFGFAAIGLGSVAYPDVFTLVVLIIALASLREFARLTARTGQELVVPVAAPAVALYIILARFELLHRWETVLLAATIVLALALALFGSRRGYFARSAYTLLGVLYIGKLLSYFVTLRNVHEGGAFLVALAIVLIAMTDVGCMLVGTSIGRTPLTSISPRKTVEGAVGGLLIVAAIGAGAAVLPFVHAPWWQGALAGAVTSLAAQAGDLVESALKRDAAVKDAGTALFGHGGWLDRFDSYMFGGVAFYGMLHLLHYLPASA